MVLFKKQFLRLNIHKQIQLGVTSVTLCVCFLSMILLTLSSYILLNLSYQDVISVIDSKENESIEELGAYVDTAILNMVEMKKYSIQFMKNFIKNNKENRDFINNIVYQGNETKLINIDSDMYNTLNNLTDSEGFNKIVYKVMKQPDSPEIQDELDLYISILSTAIPLLKEIMDFRFIHSTNIKIFDHIEIISNELSAIFSYPATIFVNSSIDYKDENLNQTISNVADWCADDFEFYMYPYTANQKFSNYYQQAIVQNPFMTFVLDTDKNTIPFIDNFSENPLLISTKGITYKDLPSTFDNNTLPLFLRDPNNILDIISGDSISSVLESYILSLLNKFKDVNILISIPDSSEYLLSTTSCLYLIDLYQKYATFYNQTNNTNVIIDEEYVDNFYSAYQTVDVCFKDPVANEKFLYYFLNEEEGYYPNIRKAKFSLFNFSNSTMPVKKWKIFKFNLPDTKTIINTRSKFMKNYALNLYVLKSPVDIQNKITQITTIFTHLIFTILWSNAALWIICITVILILLSDITEKISEPIKKIIDLVQSIQVNDIKINKIDRIRFPDDKDIDDFFNVCTNIIRGGFSDLTEDKLNNSSEDYNEYTSYDNVAVVKSNNYIIQDELIENKSDMSSIFAQKKDEYDLNDSKLGLGVNLFVKQESNISNGDFLAGNSVIKESENYSVGSNFCKFKRMESSCDSISNDLDCDSILLERIFNIVEKQDDLIMGKSFLYDMFLAKTNRGEDLKLNM